MAKDKRSKLQSSIGPHEEAMLGDNELSKEERKFEAIVEKAFKENRIPVECIEEVQVYPGLNARCVKYLEC